MAQDHSPAVIPERSRGVLLAYMGFGWVFFALGVVGRLQPVDEVLGATKVPHRLFEVVKADRLGRTVVPGRGLPLVAGLVPVMGEQRRALIDLVAVRVLERLRDTGVGAASAVAQL